jgi:hypothetical protein
MENDSQSKNRIGGGMKGLMPSTLYGTCGSSLNTLEEAIP